MTGGIISGNVNLLFLVRSLRFRQLSPLSGGVELTELELEVNADQDNNPGFLNPGLLFRLNQSIEPRRVVSMLVSAWVSALMISFALVLDQLGS